jgi:hypothetical protein
MTDIVESDSTHLIFENTPPGFTIAEFRATIDGINNAYEYLSIAVLPGYEDYPLTDRVAPRIHSRLAEQDELRITALTYGSPLDLVLNGSPLILGAIVSFLGGVGAKIVLKDGPEIIANWVNLHANIRSKHAKFEADEAEDLLRQERAEKTLEAERNTGRGGGRGDEEIAPPDALQPIERDNVSIVSTVVQREVTRVMHVVGRPEIR